MPASDGENKIVRILSLYDQFGSGILVKKQQMASYFHVDRKSIQRDISELNNYFLKTNSDCEIIYVKREKGYKLQNHSSTKFSDSDVFAIAKILLESRALSKSEMDRVMTALLCQCDNRGVEKAIRNELTFYMEPQHGQEIINLIWKISLSIKQSCYVQATYKRQDGLTKQRKLKPLGLIFSEFYFYLIADICDNETNHSATFRVDRFQNYTITNERYDIPYSNRFEESEYHKRIQFMYQGDLIHLRFKFWGDSLEAVLDRIPTAKRVGYDGKKAIVEAEVYDRGIVMWLLSQREYLEVIEPTRVRNEIKETIQKMIQNYQ